jgi:hypothetical protein
MSSVVLHPPVATAKPPHRWSLRGVHLLARRRRKAQRVFVAIMHAADIPPT